MKRRLARPVSTPVLTEVASARAARDRWRLLCRFERPGMRQRYLSGGSHSYI
jgi:hypothetical protein